MSMARLVITAVTIEGRSKSELAREYGVSRVWVQKLIHRFEADGEAAFEPRSRRPRSNPYAVDLGVEDQIVRLRKQLSKDGLDAGAETIAAHNQINSVSPVPAVSTIWRILCRRGLIHTIRSARRWTLRGQALTISPRTYGNGDRPAGDSRSLSGTLQRSDRGDQGVHFDPVGLGADRPGLGCACLPPEVRARPSRARFRQLGQDPAGALARHQRAHDPPQVLVVLLLGARRLLGSRPAAYTQRLPRLLPAARGPLLDGLPCLRRPSPLHTCRQYCRQPSNQPSRARSPFLSRSSTTSRSRSAVTGSTTAQLWR